MHDPLTLELYNAEVDLYAARVSMYAEMIKVDKLFGMQKPRFYGDPVLEGREESVTHMTDEEYCAKSAPSKCNSCGSQDFVLHQARHICSYCRQSTGQQHTDFNWSGEI